MSKLSKWWAGLFDCPLRKNKKMEDNTRQIGEIFYTLDGVKLEVCKSDGKCKNCYFKPSYLGSCKRESEFSDTGCCSSGFRKDGCKVIFKEIKEDKTMYKSDLKLGNIVECRNGNVYMLVEIKDTKALIRRNGPRELLDWYDEYLYNKNSSEFDIMKVYSASTIGSFDEMMSCKKGELLWERPEEITELTLEEVAKKFNVNVKNLRIKD